MAEWKYVEKDGNPDKKGLYLTTVIHPEVKRIGKGYSEEDFEKTGTIFADVETRAFEKVVEENKQWIMENQPNEGLVWMEESGSYMHEYVYAWQELDDINTVTLPEGVIGRT